MRFATLTGITPYRGHLGDRCACDILPFMGLDAASKVELATALLMFAGLSWAVCLMISGWREDARLYKAPPVRISLWKRLRIALNTGRLYRESWTQAPATVKQTFLVRRDIFATVHSYPKLGLRVAHPYKTQRFYGFGFRYSYSVNGATYWGEYRPWIFHQTKKEAQESAATLIETQIPIRYDPGLPEDSCPVEQGPRQS